MSWRDKPTEDCEMCQVLYRDDGAQLGCVLSPLWWQLDLRLHDNGRAAAPGRVPDRGRGEAAAIVVGIALANEPSQLSQQIAYSPARGGHQKLRQPRLQGKR
jgi:hypothetical protein